MKKYYLDFNENTPKYLQIAKHVKHLVESSEIEDGEKLPSIREYASLLGVNNVTIVNAYDRLQTEGFAQQKIGSGTFAKKRDISRMLRREYSDTFKNLSSENIKDYIDFSGETNCADFFPLATFKEVLNEVLDRDGAEALIYQEPLGFKGLRGAINNNFWGSSLNIDNLLIVSGAQQGIDIAAKSIININDNVIVERPTYSGALSVFKGRRANILEVELEEDGIEINSFEKLLKKHKIKCFYAMSYFQNPSGITYSRDKKLRILELAEEHDFYIIEDDYLSELIYNTSLKYESFKSLDKNDRVIYIKSFSKIFLPGIRLGYVICPEKFKDTMQNSKVNSDIATSSLMQRTMELYISKGFWKVHIENLNVLYKEKYYRMLKGLENHLSEYMLFNRPGGGLNFYLKLNDKVNMDCVSLFYECRKSKVLVTPGIFFYKAPQDGLKFIRLGFSQIDEEKMDRGMEHISKILFENKSF